MAAYGSIWENMVVHMDEVIEWCGWLVRLSLEISERLPVVYISLWLPGTGYVSSIAENLIMTAITSSPPLIADPLGCHIGICVIRETPQKETKPIRTPPHDLISPTTDQCLISSLTVVRCTGNTPPPVGDGKNPCRRHLYRPEIHLNVSQVKPP